MALDNMKHILLLLILFTFCFCSSKKNNSIESTAQSDIEPIKGSVNINSKLASKQQDELTTTEQMDKNHADEDCVFNNDYYTLTSEWLIESGYKNFLWNDSLKHAKIYQNGDTIVLSKGGCYHFGYTAELRLYNDTTTIANTERWVDLSIGLANRFGFEYYAVALKDQRFTKVSETDNSFWLEIIDIDPEDNMFYNGVEVIVTDTYNSISLSNYYN